MWTRETNYGVTTYKTDVDYGRPVAFAVIVQTAKRRYRLAYYRTSQRATADVMFDTLGAAKAWAEDEMAKH